MSKQIEKLQLDLALLKLVGLSINEALTLLKIYCVTMHKQLFPYNIDRKDLNSLIDRKLIREAGTGNYVVRQDGINVISKIIDVDILKEANVDVRPLEEDDLEELADKFREKFRGFKVGAMGDRDALIVKLAKWRIEHPTVTNEEILAAADMYIESLSNTRFMQRADYFVYKTISGVQTSRLTTFIEEMKAPKENSDWGSDLI